MNNYNGRLVPYRPVIAAMLLAGQSYRQIADLLWELGARSDWADQVGDGGRQSTQGLIYVMDKRWSGMRRKNRKWVSSTTSDPTQEIDWVAVLGGRAYG